VPVLQGDTAATLAARILQVEHRLYPHALSLVAKGAARLEGGRVVVDGNINQTSSLLSPAP
jgi:phosphoribosylglycinamide formyltransferase 1